MKRKLVSLQDNHSGLLHESQIVFTPDKSLDSERMCDLMLQINRYQRSEVPQVFVLQCKAELCCCCCEVLWRAVSAAAAQLELERPGRSRIKGWIFREATCGGGYPRRKTVVGHQGESNHFTTAATECSSFALYMMFHCRIVDIKI